MWRVGFGSRAAAIGVSAPPVAPWQLAQNIAYDLPPSATRAAGSTASPVPAFGSAVGAGVGSGVGVDFGSSGAVGLGGGSALGVPASSEPPQRPAVDGEAKARRGGCGEGPSIVMERLLEDSVAGLNGPTRWAERVLELLLVGEAAGGHELQVDRKADAVGPCVALRKGRGLGFMLVPPRINRTQL